MSSYNSTLQLNNNELQEILNIINELPDAGSGESGGITLPTLTNAGTAEDLLKDKQLIGQNGSVVTGTFTLDDVAENQDTLIANIIAALDGKASGITPTGTIKITQNGTYDVKNYASAEVSVPTGEEITEETNVYTSKLATLETAITALETELQGKTSGGGGSIETCNLTVEFEDSDNPWNNATILLCSKNQNGLLVANQEELTATSICENVICNSCVTVTSFSPIASVESVDGTSYIIDDYEIFIGSSDTTIRLEA